MRRSDLWWFTPQMFAIVAAAGHVKLGAWSFPWVSHVGAAPQSLACSFAAFPGTLAGSWIGSRAASAQMGLQKEV